LSAVALIGASNSTLLYSLFKAIARTFSTISYLGSNLIVCNNYYKRTTYILDNM